MEVQMSPTTAIQSGKAARGTKRTCQACGVRFYDLLRDPIVCPACGVQLALAASVAADAGANQGRASGWRQGAKRPAAVVPRDVEVPINADAAGTEDAEAADEEAATPTPDDETVLVEQDDDPDFTGLVELDVEDPKEG
jgi:uncharacterized protein (TIGR02300 family)